nr:MAG TPA: hypothetical protein [Caudoviricetes sp.]
MITLACIYLYSPFYIYLCYLVNNIWLDLSPTIR